ncbi:pre-mRNA 3'-end-processing factor FIP1 isoform X2 [Siniperca chuatsi]|uniref:pre-mRNA 3'-end-processing factor FIP1 isoform X2 n=1 Tax=Siniperca chuatsi TaxID=119488 RepID=UPI001CE078C3|nr:pre-mRNA 3'-end-processing factor FIP1 isoform X2 [Siniperca chuatsi]
MSSPESDSKVVEDEDEEKMYQLIYDMNAIDDKEEKEKGQIPSSSGHTPVHLKINAERRTHAVVGNTKGLDMDALDNIPGIPVVKANAAEKPWRKAGADISDYFNYGFDEESWITYCKKQSKRRAANRKLYTKIMVQKEHARHEEKESCSAYPSLGNSSILASRQSSVTIDVTGGQPGSSGGVEGRQCLSDEGNNTQVVTEMSPEKDRITSYHLPPPSINISSLFAFTPPPPFLYRPGPPPLSSLATLDSGHFKGLDDPSTSSGVSSLIPRSIASSAGVIDTAKAWECYIWQEKCVKDRDRSREHGHGKDSQRGRERDRESCSSSHNSGEERMRHRDTTERGHKRHSFERFSGEKERHQERRHRDKSEGWQKSSCSSGRSSSSSRSRGDGGEDRDSQSRHKHKKAKRNRKDKETNKMSSAHQERKLKSD